MEEVRIMGLGFRANITKDNITKDKTRKDKARL
jgi:hypothetical protein